MELAEARKLVHTLACRWLESQMPTPAPRVVRVVEVRPAPAAK